MKKNRMMRLASVLLVCVLLTTSVISGTYAKYVTTANAGDVARVAKWGVEIVTSGSLFAKTYATDDTTVTDTSITNSVVSSNNNEVVAPGTKNEDGMTFQITGTPEVAFKLDVVVASSDADSTAAKDVFLKAGTYADLTTGTSTAVADGATTTTGNNDTFQLTSDYYPIVYTLKSGAGDVLATGNLSAIETYLEGLSDEYTANTNLATIKDNTDGTYVLTWAWAFDTNDQADTFLGALAAGDALAKMGADLSGAPVDGTDYCLTPDITVQITVTQID